MGKALYAFVHYHRNFTVLNPLTYSYIPQFIRYVINVVLEDNSVEGVSTLPSFS